MDMTRDFIAFLLKVWSVMHQIVPILFYLFFLMNWVISLFFTFFEIHHICFIFIILKSLILTCVIILSLWEFYDNNFISD